MISRNYFLVRENFSFFHTVHHVEKNSLSPNLFFVKPIKNKIVQQKVDFKEFLVAKFPSPNFNWFNFDFTNFSLFFFSQIVMLKSLPLTARRRLSFTPNNPLPTEKKSLMTTNSRLKTKKFCACVQRKIAENISIRRKFGHFKIMLVFLQYHHCCILIFESVERKWILVTLCHRLHEFYFDFENTQTGWVLEGWKLVMGRTSN